jgi:hypothetical protein
MKYIITESQLEIIKDNILKIPFSAFNDDWNLLQKYLNKKGNPLYILKGDVDLNGNEEITTIGNLISVEGKLDLEDTQIQTLGNLTSVGGDLNLYGTEIQSIGNLTSVGGDLNLGYTKIKSLGNLTSVGGSLVLVKTPISGGYSTQQIRDMVKVGGQIYL